MLRKSHIQPQMFLSEIRSEIEAIEDSNRQYEEISFTKRIEEIDYLDFHILDRIDCLSGEIYPKEEISILKQRAISLKSRLEKINDSLFLRIRTKIQSGICRGIDFKREIDKYFAHSLWEEQDNEEIGYDNLDLLINGILPTLETPFETKEREPEMVYYQKTPARIIFELVKKVHFSETDIFYDLGSGLGQVSILVNLLTGVRSIGVEFEPEFCKYASFCASELNLKNVEFINIDARSMRYSNGTVFFMYTPFTGKILEEILEILQRESQKGSIRLFTYGPCSLTAAKQSWLKFVGDNLNNINKLHEFKSLDF